MNELKIISKSTLFDKEINVYGSVERPLFRANDVQEWLGLTNVTKAVSRVDEDERVNLKLSRGGSMWFLTEDGVYELLMQSRKPIAKQFKKGIKSILHEIRTKGGYIATTAAGTPEDIMARAVLVAQQTLAKHEQRIKELQSENEQSKQVISVQSEQLAKDAPKVEYYDQTLAAENKLTAQQIANELHISARELNKKLAEIGIIFYKSNQWMVHTPFNKWDLTGTRTYTYYNSKTDTTIAKPYLVWNQRGRRFIHALYNNGFNIKLAIAEIKGNIAK